MLWIGHSVGRHGENVHADVIVVQSLLNRFGLPHKNHLKVDGYAGPLTNGAIVVFQLHIGFEHPDGLVQPGGRTWQALTTPFLMKEVFVDLQNAWIKAQDFILNPAGSIEQMDRSMRGVSFITRTPRSSVKQNDLTFYDWDKRGAVVNAAILSPQPAKVAWGAKVSSDFKVKLFRICKDLSLNPDYLMTCMALESDRTFSPSVVNKSSGATGLIQFMPQYSPSTVGATTADLAKMSSVQQLDYVERYFRYNISHIVPKKERNNIKRLVDVYLVILAPASVGKPDGAIVYAGGTGAYSGNAGSFDPNKTGNITVGGVAQGLQVFYKEGLEAKNFG
ncbi:peptidoglycan-binding protein [Acidocella facilis]|uniref:peptidoglycan-binding protein n=1 Tax=Acidocella facilis TaxID=525 RepID=UPI0012DFD3E9|nr:peptidoglycan-binding protein [Acidocella facilis]